MAKRNPKIEDKLQEVLDQAATYGRELGRTMSVDDYFDELIEQVRQGYANV